MATNYFPSQNVEVWFQKETTVGDQPDDAGLKKLQTTSFTIPEASVPVEYSAQRAGHFTMTEGQGHHAEGTKMWTFDTTLRGTPDSIKLACESVFEDAASEFRLENNYTFPTATYQNGESSASTFEIRFENGGSDATLNNVVCQGCVGTGFTITQDIGSEGGELVCTINWATGYYPTISGDAISSAAYDSGNATTIRTLAAASCTVGGEPVVLQSWELSVNRTIERIHYADNTSGTFEPYGYAMTGGFEVTGTMNCIRNDEIHDLLAKFRDSNTVAINIQDTTASSLTIALPKCFLNEPSVDNGGAVLMQTIPFTVVGEDDISSATKMVGIIRA